MYTEDRLLPWVDDLLARVGEVVPFDAHCHIGIADPAGLLATADELLHSLDLVQGRALVFPLKEPEGYDEANDAMLALAAAHPGRLAALARLDPARDPTDAARRALEGGAAGLKLHPRGEGFAIDDARLDDAFALADADRSLVMVHAGVGSPEIGEHALARARRHPGAQIVLAHAAIGAFEAVVPHAAEVPNLRFDTSWWNPADVLALLRLVPPTQVLMASDVPFASPAEGIVLTGRLGLQAGLRPEQLRGVLGGTLERLVAREEPEDLGPVDAAHAPLAPELERVYVALCAAVESMQRGQDGGQGLQLARIACEQDHEDRDVLTSVAQLLDEAARQEDRDPLRSGRAPGHDLVLIAAVVARTPRAGVPRVV
jgi:uncharacterized protein